MKLTCNAEVRKPRQFSNEFGLLNGNLYTFFYTLTHIHKTVHLRDVDYYYDQWSNCSTNELESTNTTSKRARSMARIQQSLIAAQELGDEKLQVVTQLQEMIDLKTRQLDADFKNLEYADKDDPALMDNSPKDMHPSSPSSYVPSAMNNPKHDDLLAVGASIGGPSTGNIDRNNGNNTTNIGTNINATNSNNSADRSWKRSRRARNETSARSGNSANAFTNVTKSSQIDLITDSNSNSNHSKSNASTSGQQSNIGGTSNNRKQGGNGGGNNNSNKKRKRKSGRSNNGSNGKIFLWYLGLWNNLLIVFSFQAETIPVASAIIKTMHVHTTKHHRLKSKLIQMNQHIVYAIKYHLVK